MTDNEIMKALDSVGTATGVVLGHHSGQADIIADRFRELIDENNRQKAEIERLKKEVEDKERAYNDEFCLRKEWQSKCRELLEEKQTTKSEAIKEFAERLKEKCYEDFQETCEMLSPYVTDDDIDNLVKEMME